ncbi:MAG TPA: IS481 family transposase [Acidimicrobiales bacterium]|nr:IS481 family transposase [Acidimicrobiales bacterium]
MNAEEKVARHRMSVLELAEALGNVSEACRRRGMTRTQFYEYKRRFQTHGLAGLKDLPPVHKSHPQATPQHVVDRILTLSLEHPAWGCCRLSALLKLEGVSVSSPTVQNILAKHGMATKYDRLLRLEEKAAAEPIELTAEQIALIERANPAYAERHVESSRPGELLAQDLFYVGHLKGVGKVYLDAVVDTYGSYAFGFLHTGKLPEAAAAVLHNDVLPFYAARELPVAAILTDNGKEYCGTEAHPYEIYLALNDIEHRTTRVKHPWTNGFVERFHRTVLDEFFRAAFRTRFYESVVALQADLDAWLVYYNTQRPHLGYRNRGKRPLDTITDYLASLREKSVA